MKIIIECSYPQSKKAWNFEFADKRRKSGVGQRLIIAGRQRVAQLDLVLVNSSQAGSIRSASPVSCGVSVQRRQQVTDSARRATSERVLR